MTKSYITKSKSGHYTVTIRVDGCHYLTIAKIGNLASARREAAEAVAKIKEGSGQ